MKQRILLSILTSITAYLIASFIAWDLTIIKYVPSAGIIVRAHIVLVLICLNVCVYFIYSAIKK